jgi:hypothetical protein
MLEAREHQSRGLLSLPIEFEKQPRFEIEHRRSKIEARCGVSTVQIKIRKAITTPKSEMEARWRGPKQG